MCRLPARRLAAQAQTDLRDSSCCLRRARSHSFSTQVRLRYLQALASSRYLEALIRHQTMAFPTLDSNQCSATLPNTNIYSRQDSHYKFINFLRNFQALHHCVAPYAIQNSFSCSSCRLRPTLDFGYKFRFGWIEWIGPLLYPDSRSCHPLCALVLYRCECLHEAR